MDNFFLSLSITTNQMLGLFTISNFLIFSLLFVILKYFLQYFLEYFLNFTFKLFLRFSFRYVHILQEPYFSQERPLYLFLRCNSFFSYLMILTIVVFSSLLLCKRFLQFTFFPLCLVFVSVFLFRNFLQVSHSGVRS